MPREHRRALRGVVARARLPVAIAPMIDVVFLLLVYFLLTTGFTSQERLLRTEGAPLEDAVQTSDRLVLDTEPIVVRLDRVDAQTRLSLTGGLAQPIDVRGLEAILHDAMIAPDRPQGLFAESHPVRIAPGHDVPWNDVVAAFNAVVGAGYRSVAFGSRE